MDHVRDRESSEMKIGIVSTLFDFAWTGGEELWAAMAYAALGQDHEVLISVTGWPKTPDPILALQRRGARVFFRYPLRRTWKYKDRLIRILEKYKIAPIFQNSAYRVFSSFRSFFESGPDVVLINQGGLYDALIYKELLFLLERTRVPYVIISHFAADTGPSLAADRAKAIQFLSRASRLAVVAKASLETMERQLACPIPGILVLRNPVNLPDLSSIAWPEQKPLRFANLARLEVGTKGQDLLLKSLYSKQWLNREWRLSLCGKGPDEEYLRELARYYGLADRIDFLGHIEDIRALWSQHHLLVLPSRSESAPLALVEAMLCGRPSVVTDVGGVREWVQEPQTGFVAEAPAPGYYTSALERAWQARDTWRQMGTQAHEAAITRYDPRPGKTLLEVVIAASKTRSAVKTPNILFD